MVVMTRRIAMGSHAGIRAGLLWLLLGVSGRNSGENSDWKLVGRANSLQPVEVLLVLKRDPVNLKKLEKIFWEVSDPKSKNYGNHLTQDEVTALIGIKDDQLSAVTDYLKKNEAQVEVNAHRDMVMAKLSRTAAEAMFQTTLFKFQNRRRPRITLVRSQEESVTIPDELKDYVELVDNLVGLPKLTTQPKTSKPSTKEYGYTGQYFNASYACNGLGRANVTPKVLAQRYKTNGPLTYTESHGRMAVAEFQGEDWSTYQLSNFNQGCHVNATVDNQVGWNA